jgi:hypothetical protein
MVDGGGWWSEEVHFSCGDYAIPFFIIKLLKCFCLLDLSVSVIMIIPSPFFFFFMSKVPTNLPPGLSKT